MAYNCAQCANWRKSLKEPPCGPCKVTEDEKCGSEFKAAKARQGDIKVKVEVRDARNKV